MEPPVFKRKKSAQEGVSILVRVESLRLVRSRSQGTGRMSLSPSYSVVPYGAITSVVVRSYRTR